MATKHNPNKEALKKNRLEIIDGLANPKSVVDYLFTVGLFDEDMKEDVMQIKPTRDQTRKMLDILGYRGKTAAKGLSDAFLNTSNKELAVLLAPYIETIQSEDNKMNPKNSDDEGHKYHCAQGSNSLTTAIYDGVHISSP